MGMIAHSFHCQLQARNLSLQKSKVKEYILSSSKLNIKEVKTRAKEPRSQHSTLPFTNWKLQYFIDIIYNLKIFFTFLPISAYIWWNLRLDWRGPSLELLYCSKRHSSTSPESFKPYLAIPKGTESIWGGSFNM